VSGVPTKPSLSALHRCPWHQGTPEQAKVKPVVRSFVHRPPSTTPLGPCTVLLSPSACTPLPLSDCIYLQRCSETPLPPHSQSLILAPQARSTPITLEPPLSLQVTDHLPSHAFDTGAVVISPSTVLPRGHVPSRAPTSTYPEEARSSKPPLDWTLARALPLSCARYGPELLGGRAAHFIRPFRTTPVPTGRGGPYTLE
jgi:hypothetical protein